MGKFASFRGEMGVAGFDAKQETMDEPLSCQKARFYSLSSSAPSASSALKLSVPFSPEGRHSSAAKKRYSAKTSLTDLRHDIAYTFRMGSREDRLCHGRR